MLDLVETRERENKWWASGIILCVCVCTRLCLHTFLCAYERLHVYLICFQEHLIRDFEMQVSTRRKVCLFGHRRMFSSMLPGTLNDFPPLSSHSGRSWEELNSYRHTNLKAQKSDKMWQAPELLPFSASPFLSHSCFRSPLVEKKKSLQQTSFYNLGESLTTAITHDKVFN